MSRGNSKDAALTAFVARKTAIDALLDRLHAYSQDHFGVSPDDVNWGHVGSLAEAETLLERTADFLGLDQESKSSK